MTINLLTHNRSASLPLSLSLKIIVANVGADINFFHTSSPSLPTPIK
jgi:hypothetical protein